MRFFGLRIVRERRYEALLDSVADMALEGVALERRLREAKALAEGALRRWDDVRGCGMGEREKSEECTRAFVALVKALREV